VAVKFQYNKTEIQRLNKQLAIREKALPTLKSKETALRLEVKKIALEIEKISESLNNKLQVLDDTMHLWVEMPDILVLKKTGIKLKNIAGVKIPVLENIEFDQQQISYINQPAWVPAGLQHLKELIRLRIEIKIKERQFEILNYARKKTTQKVNLYEKVQIPEFSSAVLKIKRFLEDAENLSKSSQKIVKQRNAEKEAAL
jgi:V/A-type H+/Na+-transporting ATPase subunit D